LAGYDERYAAGILGGYMPTIFSRNGAIKNIDLSTITAEGWRDLFGLDAGAVSRYAAFKTVSTLYACVDKRAKAVESMPFYFERDGERLEDNADVHQLERNLRGMLYSFEASLCVYAAAYAVRESNRIGVESLRWLSSAQILPLLDPYRGLLGFNRLGSNIAPDELVHIWRNDLTCDVGPGSSPVDAALAAAGVILGVNNTVSEKYRAGLLKAFILSVKGVANPADLTKLEETFRTRLMRGVKGVFEVLAVRADVTPQIISSDIKESMPVEMVNAANEAIATALGVPQSLVKSEALAGGTVDADRLSFYDFTIVPECNLIADALNDQYYTQYGLEVVFEPGELEVYQSAQLAQSITVAQLTGGKQILTVDEARKYIGLESNPKLSKTTEPPAAPALPVNDQAQAAANEVMPVDQVAQERAQLKRYAHNRLRDGKSFEFHSGIISARDVEAIKACTSHSAIDAVTFSQDDTVLLQVLDEMKAARLVLQEAMKQ
jgi:hypothetical protein